MSDQELEPQAAEPQAQPNAEPTLEDVYASVKFDEPQQQAQPAAQPQQQQPVQQVTQPAPSSVPDPYDQEAFKAYMARQAGETATLNQALNSIVGTFTKIQREEAQRALDADIKSAVESVNKVVGHDKPKVIEAMLDAKAREDVRFRNLWENRQKHPTAWNNALGAVAREFANDLSVRVDPSLTAAQRARKLSQAQMATTAPEPEASASWDNLSQADFDAKWQQTVSGGY